ncbi:MAG: glycogen debranching enzyme [Clostridiales Family XIII bacterium]|nr:glycogen debranching enzyme [Clostridiales Family XIII bacterium]
MFEQRGYFNGCLGRGRRNWTVFMELLTIDSYPTKTYEGLRLRPGHPLPFGASVVHGGVNFSVYSRAATSCKLALFHRNDAEPFAMIPFFDEFCIGDVFAMIVYDIDIENVEYGYIMDGPNDARTGHRFDRTKVLLDPYAKIIVGRDTWSETQEGGQLRPYRSRVAPDDFDWQGDRPLETDINELIIYETHVRGFTRHASSGSKYPGTFTALREKIPYLLELGVNCVELMPVFEYDEFENWRTAPGGNGKLLNYWGYSTVGFFAPKAGLAASGRYGMQMDELKTLVRALHKNGLEIILDVVFNHTAEGNENGPYLSFRGIDNNVYYMLAPNKEHYYNFSGCGNTLNCNHPIVRNMILDCLRYWAAEYHIDGFRFDLASILGRNQDGAPMTNPPLLEELAYDAVLGKCKLIAEAWDAGGMYQVGSFPSWGRWAEWNGRYRDDIRRFLKGDPGLVWPVSQYIAGSPHMYDPAVRGNCASINFITCHDGFTLWDLYAYNSKQNMANGEENNDGSNDNHSWDCRCEKNGAYDEGATLHLRKRMIKNAFAFLLLSRGAPMLLAGDEFCNTQYGNNNAYCQDNEISWLDWKMLRQNRDIFEYVKRLIRLRRECACLKSGTPGGDRTSLGYSRISFHGERAWQADYSGHTLGVLYCCDEEYVYAGFNMHWEDHRMELPQLPWNRRWRVYESSWDESENGMEKSGGVLVKNRAAVILRGELQKTGADQE